ncbi:BPTI/Kunitz domain-containing protein [Alcanivorax sediminis]|uniref:Alpha-1-antitrypsin n=1 Tax=Alcanivorax sediminis TaxID=2663008 RepID=A0A6N7LWK0_9GAMM|nr:BPTI/Kunitz domain-containing protein [Alcanivorax sediminis]MQX52611.1 alpha-1-antitrypsin [Alcanivorax sediminis]
MRTLPLSLLLALGLLTGCQNSDSETPLPDACYQPPESGMCKASFQRYYYDADTDSCRTFIWGGCKGSVPFETLDACVSTCGASNSETATPDSGKGAPR